MTGLNALKRLLQVAILPTFAKSIAKRGGNEEGLPHVISCTQSHSALYLPTVIICRYFRVFRAGVNVPHKWNKCQHLSYYCFCNVLIFISNILSFGTIVTELKR